MQQSKSIWNIIAIWSIVASLIVFSGNLGSNQVNAASYDSNAAYSYAEKYAYKVCSDGYFYEITWPPSKLGAGVPVPSGGYDCAHFVSCCIGSEPNEQGGGLDVPSRTGVEYGEPGAERLGDWLLDNNVGIEASSIDEIEKGDVINYDWDGDGHWDHAAIYLGNYKIAAHSNSHWNAFWNLGGAQNYRFIHITTADQNPPAASASDLSGQPQTMEPNTVYSVIAKYYDADGRDNLKYCYLRLRHPSKPLTMMWHEPGDLYDTWEGEEGKNYLTITDVSSVNISNGYQLTWKFKINDKWPPVNNAIDFGVFAEDDNDLTSGWDYDNTKASFIIAKPDLVVQNPTVTSNGPYYPGSSLSVSCVIKNQGQGTAGSSKVKYYLSTSSTGTDYDLGYDSVDSLSPGGISSESGTFTIPSIPCDQSYYVVFYADADGQVSESNENNNKSNAGTINVQCPPPELAADAGADKTICHPNNGGTHSIQIGGAPTASGGTPPYDYKWSPSTGLNNTSIANPTASPTTTTTYTVTVTDANNDTATDSVTVVVNPELIANAGENVTINEGDSTTIGGSPTASGGTPPYEYSWTPSTGLNNPNIANPVASPDVTTTYTVTVTDAIGCQDSDSVTVTVGESCFYVDIDCDCDVDVFDILLVATAWGCEVGDTCYDEKCDVNDDGAIDVFDILEVATYWGEDVCETAAPSLIAIEKASSPATVRLQASASKITVGDSFNIELFASLPSAVQAFEFKITYSQNAYAPNQPVVRFEKLEGDNLLKDKNGTVIHLGPKIDRAKGTIAYGGILLGKNVSGKSSGRLANLTFTALLPGDCQISISNIKLVNSDYNLIPIKITHPIKFQIKPKPPKQIALLQNYPNPFNPETWIPYQLAFASDVKIQIYDVSGRLVRTLNLGYKHAGYYQDKASAAYWNGRNEAGEKSASGVYFYSIQAGNYTATRKMLLME